MKSNLLIMLLLLLLTALLQGKESRDPESLARWMLEKVAVSKGVGAHLGCSHEGVIAVLYPPY